MTDDRLLDRLASALVPVAAPSTPSAAALQDLHRAIDAARTAATAPPRRPGPRVITIAVAAMVAACAAIGIVSTTRPRIDPETATRVTVTATSPALGAVTDRQRALETALTDGDAAAVATAAERLRLMLVHLTPGEWIPIRRDIENLLARADTVLHGGRGSGLAPGVSQDATTTTAGVSPLEAQPTTSAPPHATSPAAPPPTGSGDTRPSGTPGPTSSPVVPPAGDGVADDDNSGPGNATDDNDVVSDVIGDPEDNSGPGGGGADDDSSGPGGGGDSGGGGD